MFIYTTRLAATMAAVTALLATIALTTAAAPVIASETCPNEAVRAESRVNPTTGQPYSMGLPECRAYEMVSPPEKGESDIIANRALPVAADGDAVQFLSQNAFGDAENAIAGAFEEPHDQYVARRGSAGWMTSSANPPRSLVAKPGIGRSASPGDFNTVASCGLTVVNNATAGSSAVCALRETNGPWISTPIYPNLTGQIYGDVTGNDGISFEGSSSDLSHLLFAADEPGGAFLPAAKAAEADGGASIYDVTGLGKGTPELSLVNVDNGGEEIGPEHSTVLGGMILNGSCNTGPSNSVQQYQAVSASGSTIYFTACPGGEGNVDTVYARINATSTVAVSNPSPSQCTTCDPTPSPAVFVGASADGSKAFFLTSQQLVNGDTDHTADLYEHDFNNPPGNNEVQLSAGGAGDLAPGSGAEVQGVVATSADGSHVYFVAKGVLTTVPDLSLPSGHQVAEAGADNLYAADTVSGQTSFVAALCSNKEESGSLKDSQCSATLNGATFEGTNDGALWNSTVLERQTRTTPDGRYLLFTTYAKLAPGDAGTAQDVYRYDFQTGELTWVSHCAPDDPGCPAGTTNDINATIIDSPDEQGEGAYANVNDKGRAMSEDGSTIVFSTPERLQANATNTGNNVYEWHEGVVSMISGGQDAVAGARAGTTAVGMSASGSDIFFLTRTPLVGQDTDQFIDVYDARIGGGFPVPTPEPSCSGEACQGSASPGPALGASGTSSFTGGGNLTPGSTAFHPPVQETKPKPLTRTQMLTKALKNCKKNKSKAKRKSCETQTRHKYAPSKHKATKKH
jgi:hypothetical protein